MNEVFVLGGYQSDFARNAARAGLSISDLMAETALGACEHAGVAPAEIEVAHIGNFVGEVLARQGHIGGLLADADPDFEGVAAQRHEAACASGSMAAMSAMADLQAGRYDVALVLGVEHMRADGTRAASDALGLAARVPDETEGLDWPWPGLFAELDEEYDRRHGVSREHLSQLSAWAFEQARDNPLAQTRDWSLPDGAHGSDDEANPVVAGRVRRHDCSQITDGAAAVVMVSERWLSRSGGRAVRPMSRIAGWGHRTGRMGMKDKLAAARSGPDVLPLLRTTVSDALTRASVSIGDVNGAEVHDCFTITQYAIADHLGLAPPGKAGSLIDDGVIGPGGSFPLNPSGGLIGVGHPVGATGVRMLLDASRQVAGEAGAAQVDGASRFATVNIGGSATTIACLVVEEATR